MKTSCQKSGFNFLQAAALLFLTTLSNALLEALSAVSEAVSDLQLNGKLKDSIPEQKGSPVAGINEHSVISAGHAQGLFLLMSIWQHPSSHLASWAPPAGRICMPH